MMKSSLHIFHIDDNPLDRELIRDALEQDNQHFILTVASSRQEFETSLSTGNFDLVLTDFNILGFNGLQVIDAVREIDPLLPVIVVTGTGSEEVAVEAMKRGAYDYVIKTPHHIRRLPLVIRSAIERKQLMEERVLSEKALKSSEERLRAFANAVPDLAFIMDEDGRYIELLNAPEHLLYRPEEKLSGKLAIEVLPDDVATQILNAIHRTVESGTTQSVEYELNLTSGNRWFEGRVSLMSGVSNGKQLVVYVARDITSRKRMEESLRKSEEHLQAVVSGTPVILFAFDRKGMLTLLQGQGLNVFTIDPQLYLEQSVFDTLGDLIPHIQEHFQLALQGEETGSIQTIGERILDVRYSPLRETTGNINGVIGVATDITERLRAERLQIELEKEQEMIALKERFISTASHDFRTPLTIIKMSANVLEKYDGQFTAEQRMAKLHQISKQVDKMNQLIDDVLTMSKANSGKIDFRPNEIELKPFCQEIWDNFQQLAEKTHQMDIDYQCNKELVVIDPNLIHYILANLLSNAIKYSPTNGHVRFEVSCDDTQLTFRIHDNGIGIPEADVAQLFQPFHRATNVKGFDGTGLGLSIVKTYVESHHGHINVESKENLGSTFTISIPIE